VKICEKRLFFLWVFSGPAFMDMRLFFFTILFSK